MNAQIPPGAHFGRHVVILCHPDPTSCNHSIAAAYCAEVRCHGHEAVLRDLSAMGLDPVLKTAERPTLPNVEPSRDVVAEQAIIAGGDAG